MFKRMLFLLILVLVIAGTAYAQMPIPIRSATERLELLEVMENNPCYIVVTGELVNTTGSTLISTFRIPLLEGARWYVFSGYLFITFSTVRNGTTYSRTVCIMFDTNRENSEASKTVNEAEGSTVYGPFGGDASEAARRASLQRIINAVNAFIANPTVTPTQW